MKTAHYVWSKTFMQSAIVLAISVLTFSARMSFAQCAQWDLVHGGQWQFHQSNKVTVTMNLKQQGKLFTGTAHYETQHWVGDKEDAPWKDLTTTTGEVDGSLDGNTFNAKIFWANKIIGVYTGTMSPQGRLEGTSWEQQAPSKKWTWYSYERFNCGSQPAAGPAAPEKPIIHTGKARTPEEKPIVHTGKAKSPTPTPSVNAAVQVSPGSGEASISAVPSGGEVSIQWTAPGHPRAEVFMRRGKKDKEAIGRGDAGSTRLSLRPGQYTFVVKDGDERLASTDLRL